MAKYRNKTIVNIVPFEWGMEDGVKLGIFIIPKNADTYPKHMGSTEYPGYLAIYDDEQRGFYNGNHVYNPYLNTLDGPLLIPQGTYIATDGKRKWAMTYEFLKDNYELVEE